MSFDPTAWHWPQWAMAVMMVLSVIITCSQHGKLRKGEHNGFLSIIGFAISLFILTCGGFFGGHA